MYLCFESQYDWITNSWDKYLISKIETSIHGRKWHIQNTVAILNIVMFILWTNISK